MFARMRELSKEIYDLLERKFHPPVQQGRSGVIVELGTPATPEPSSMLVSPPMFTSNRSGLERC